jgi:hypothetical protein
MLRRNGFHRVVGGVLVLRESGMRASSMTAGVSGVVAAGGEGCWTLKADASAAPVVVVWPRRSELTPPRCSWAGLPRISPPTSCCVTMIHSPPVPGASWPFERFAERRRARLQSREFDAGDAGRTVAERQPRQLLPQSQTAGVGLEIAWAGTGERIMVREGAPVVRVSGPLGELLLHLFGRRAAAQVEGTGPEPAIAAVGRTVFGMG